MQQSYNNCSQVVIIVAAVLASSSSRHMLCWSLLFCGFKKKVVVIIIVVVVVVIFLLSTSVHLKKISKGDYDFLPEKLASPAYRLVRDHMTLDPPPLYLGYVFCRFTPCSTWAIKSVTSYGVSYSVGRSLLSSMNLW